MLRVHSQNDLGALVAHLDERLPADPVERAFGAPWVVVPDGVTAAFVRDALARRNGVAAGLRFLFPEAFAAAVCGAGPAGGDGAARLLDRDRLRSLLLDLLDDREVLADPVLAPVRDYLACEDERPRRLLLLASRLARHLSAYAATRPRELARWDADAPAFGGDAPHEPWQRALYRRLFAPGGVLDRIAAAGGGRWVLPGRAAAFDPRAAELPPRVDVVAPEPLPPEQIDLLERVAEVAHVAVHRWTPVVPFRELLPPGADAAATERLPSRADDVPPPEEQPSVLENALLPLWGVADLEQDRAWSARARARPERVALEGGFELPAGGSLLDAVRRHVLLQAPRPAGPGALPADGSLTAAARPTRRDEVEGAAEVLLARLAEEAEAGAGERPLQLDECALLVPRALDAYRPLIATVFRAADLPVTFLDGRPDERLLEGAQALLALPEGALDRRGLAAVLTHPAVLARVGLERADVVAWLDALAIHLGADGADHAGTYLEGEPVEPFTVDAGLRRLVLGAFTEGEAAGELRSVELPDGPTPPADVSPDRRAAAARFAAILRSLVADVRASSAPRPLSEWGPWLGGLVETYLAPADEDEHQLADRLVHRLRALGERDLGGRDVPYPVAAACAREALAHVRHRRGRNLAGGVLVARALPPLPLRHAVVLGLDESFPQPEAACGLDLRGERRPGDPEVSAPLAEGRAVLATLASAERVHLSYVARDERGDERYPSPVLTHLRRVLAAGFLAPEAAADWLDEAPSDDAAPRAPSPPDGAGDEGDPAAERAAPRVPRPRAAARARALRRDLARHLGAGAPLPPLERLRAAVSDDVRSALDGLLGTAAPLARAAPGGEAEVVEVTVSQLKGFLRSPAQQTARRVGLPEEDDDPLTEESEPLEVSRLARALLLREAFDAGWNEWRAWPGAGDPDEALRGWLNHALQEVLERERSRGRLPGGPFLDAARRGGRDELEAWARNLRRVLGDEAPGVIHLRLGGVEGGGQSRERVVPALELPVEVPGPDGAARRVRVRVHGRLPRLLDDLGGNVTLGLATSPRTLEKYVVLDGFLAHVLLAASELRAAAPFRPYPLPPEVRSPPWTPGRLAPLSKERARDHLARLVADLLAGQWTLLPIEAVLDYARTLRPNAKRGRGPATLQDAVVAARDLRSGSASCAYGPLRRVGHLEPPPEAEAQRILRRRFGLYLELKGEPLP